MAQLSDDCFAHGGTLMPLDEALALLDERLRPVRDIQTVPLAEAADRVLAEDIVAAADVPPHDNSAVDGYAVCFDDLDPSRQTRLPVTGRAAAGHPLGRAARRGEAIRIFTGAAMPDGLDTVMMQEDCREDGDHVILAPGIAKGANRRRRGEDVKRGQTILRRGRRLRPQDLGLAAAVGQTDVVVYEPLRVAIFSTGDEVREPGQPLPDGAIYDANRHMLVGAVSRLGCTVRDLGILPDDAAVIREALSAAAACHDLLLTSGGVSVGEEDHVKAAVEASGSMHFWRLAIKPGRPVAMGQIGATPIVGLPGNPGAALVTFLLVARPLLLRLAGVAEISPHRYRVTVDFDYSKKAGRREFVRAKLQTGQDGMPLAVKHGRSGAGILSSMVEADGLLDLAADVTYLESGSTADFLPFSEVLT
ncbi:MAG: molybdopterin molybdotransferase MoeA [Rhodospirillales bacterium]|nr:MAG: molybdopterin molybdotransferase MoeA [Rhodospirillales bacterium]